MTNSEKVEIGRLVDEYVQAAATKATAERRASDAYGRLDVYLHGLVKFDEPKREEATCSK
jgi:hypothetical protein